MRRLLLLPCLFLLALAPVARGHVFEFTDTRVVLTGDGRFVAEMVADLDALALGVDPALDPGEVAAAIRALSPAEREATEARLRRFFEIRVRVRFDGQPAPFALSFPGAGEPAGGAGADELRWQGSPRGPGGGGGGPPPCARPPPPGPAPGFPRRRNP
jgi:hypothetical protein